MKTSRKQYYYAVFRLVFLWTFLLEHVILNVILKKLRSIKMNEPNNELYTYMVQILANPVKN